MGGDNRRLSVGAEKELKFETRWKKPERKGETLSGSAWLGSTPEGTEIRKFEERNFEPKPRREVKYKIMNDLAFQQARAKPLSPLE